MVTTTRDAARRNPHEGVAGSTGVGMFRFLSPTVDVDVPIGNTGWILEKQRRFVRKTITLGIAIVTLAPLLWYKSEVGATIYLAALVAIHVFALAVFLHKVQWRELFSHKAGLIARVGGLVIFGGLLGVLKFDPASNLFWLMLTLLWAFHVAALALLHVRHRAELKAFATGEQAECPIPWPASVKEAPPKR